MATITIQDVVLQVVNGLRVPRDSVQDLSAALEGLSPEEAQNCMARVLQATGELCVEGVRQDRRQPPPLLKHKARGLVNRALDHLKEAEQLLNDACCEQAPGVMASLADLESPIYQAIDKAQKQAQQIVKDLRRAKEE